MSGGYDIGLEAGLGALRLARDELLLFAAFWFIVGAIDELAIDVCWLWLRLSGRVGTPRLAQGVNRHPLSGRAAVFVPAWHEADVIGAMIAHTLSAWPQRDFRLFVGCYRNDPATLGAAIAAARNDPRLRLVVHDAAGPTTKADCLNRLYKALCDEEGRTAKRFATVVLQDAEDMVHPAALVVIDRALKDAEFVQLPVRPEPQARSPWVAGQNTESPQVQRLAA